MKTKYGYIIVEDVELQREYLITLLSDRLNLTLLGVFSNAEEAFEYLVDQDKQQPDILFLDIEMPEVNGFSLLEAIKRTHVNMKVIITTAHSDYAVRSYDYQICGYLLKPIEPHRLSQALDRAIKELNTPSPALAAEAMEAKSPATTGASDRLSPESGGMRIKEKNRWIKLDYNEILYCEGANVDVKIVTLGGVHQIRERVKNLEKTLPAEQFLRVHDSFIINLDYVKSFASNFTFVDICPHPGDRLHTIRIGPKYRNAFRDRMKATPFEPD
jgi:DNA-binding LytR/AlgR family response regulator